MKYIVLILFCTFAQTDSIKVDTVIVNQSMAMQKSFDKTNNKLDSIIAILEKDTIKNKKR